MFPFQFGPQLVAGPIIRAQDMLHQFLESYTFKKKTYFLESDNFLF
ncbi:hypothetical protein LEP1GSC085_2327 [Leptospira interrogans str. L0996]|nr:hypothetical protein LEP1GSC085_2327 [Leptospira interrogans str. L0996]